VDNCKKCPYRDVLLEYYCLYFEEKPTECPFRDVIFFRTPEYSDCECDTDSNVAEVEQRTLDLYLNRVLTYCGILFTVVVVLIIINRVFN